MKLTVFTIVLDGMPWITKHLDILKATNLDWQWIVVEGSAQNNGSTSWCKPQEFHRSTDGTMEYLWSIRSDRVKLLGSDRWNSKDDMCNAALSEIKEPCVLMEIDSDEIWEPWQLEAIVKLFEKHYDLAMIKFACNYYVGEDLITKGEHCYGDMDYEWDRAWRFQPGMTWLSHEPPKLNGLVGRTMTKEVSKTLVGKFNHYAYATEAQVVYKEKFYGYKGLLEGWRRLQEQRMFPVFLRDFFPHVHDPSMVVRA